jgi:putative transposase
VTQQHLLFELGSEELPPKTLLKLSNALLDGIVQGLTDYFLFYNGERKHQSLGYTTPDMVYHTATGCGAKIVDRFNSVRGSIVPAEELGQHQLAVV